jgi:hypothetical protein
MDSKINIGVIEVIEESSNFPQFVTFILMWLIYIVAKIYDTHYVIKLVTFYYITVELYVEFFYS